MPPDSANGNACTTRDVLEQMALDMEDIRFSKMRGGSVAYDLRKSADGKMYSYHLMFVRDEDGLWKIRSF